MAKAAGDLMSAGRMTAINCDGSAIIRGLLHGRVAVRRGSVVVIDNTIRWDAALFGCA